MNCGVAKLQAWYSKHAEKQEDNPEKKVAKRATNP